jgi:phosphohistidine phosphatase
VNLYLIRHAKTEKTATSGKDFDRKLAEKGHLQAEKLNDFIAKFDFKTVDIWCSNAVRTKQTLSLRLFVLV